MLLFLFSLTSESYGKVVKYRQYVIGDADEVLTDDFKKFHSE